MKRRVIVALATPLLAGLSIVVWWNLTAAPVALQIRCVPGQTYGFEVDYNSHGELLDPRLGLPLAGSSANPSVAVGAHGRATETCVESTGDRLVFALEFGEVAGEAAMGPGIRQPVSAALIGTSFVELQPDGVVRSIQFAAGMPVLGESIVRDLLSHRSMKLPARPANAWQSEEVSIDGRYLGGYQVEHASEAGAELTKRRTSAPAAKAAVVDRPQARYLDGTRASMRLAHDWLHDLDSTTRVEVMSGNKVVATTTTRVAMRGVAVESRAIAALRAMLSARRSAGAPTGDLAASEADRRLDDKIQREELRDETWTTLWDKARAQDPDQAKVFLGLRALLKLHPEECKTAAAALAGITSVKDNAFMLVASALAATGSQESQAALREAVTASAGKHAQQQVLIAELGTLGSPESATEAYVRDVFEHAADVDMRNVAQLALGNMARTLDDSEPERADALVTEALQHAQSATAPGDRMVSIQTLGNTGSPRALDLLRIAASDPSFMVRQAAASALRFIEGDAAEQVLLTLALRDPEPSVRVEAATSLRTRTLATASYEALAALVRHDPAESVRQALVSLLAAGADHFPDALGAIAWVADHDLKKDVRNYAQMALMQLRARST